MASTALGSVVDVESFINEYFGAWQGTDEDRIMSYPGVQRPMLTFRYLGVRSISTIQQNGKSLRGAFTSMWACY